MEQQTEFAYARLIDIQNVMPGKVKRVKQLNEGIERAESLQIKYFGWMYKVGCAGVAAYFTWRALGGEAPRFTGDDVENVLASIFKFVSPSMVIMGLGAKYFTNGVIDPMRKERKELLNGLGSLISEEKRLLS